MFLMTSSYITSAVTAQQLPKPGLPEVAFIGRSNCGKSSLLNALLARKNLARTSRTPGRTQMANFFDTGKEKLFVDLPGYGYSKTHEKVREGWEALLDGYLERPSLERCLVLLDIRREMKEEDFQFLEYIALKAPLSVVLTKTDKLSRSAALTTAKAFASKIEFNGIEVGGVFATSSTNKDGISDLRLHLGLPANS